jgi:hypothetical protein
MRKPHALFTTLLVMLVSVPGCGPRVNLSTGTTIGLKVTPGDGNTRPPQVTLGYKRAELSLVPVEGNGATADTDAASTLASLHFSTAWFGHTELDSFIASGWATQQLVEPSSAYTEALAQVTLRVIPDAIQARRAKLANQLDQFSEAQAQNILDRTQYSRRSGKNAKESLRDYILDAQTEPNLERLESAFFRQP